MLAGERSGCRVGLLDDAVFPVLLIVSSGITTFVALAALWAIIFCIDAFIPALAWVSALLGAWFLAIGIAVFVLDLLRRLWIVRTEILMQV